MTQSPGARMRKENGWRYYPVEGGEIGVGRLRMPKFFPDSCRLNSSYLTRSEAAQAIRDATWVPVPASEPGEDPSP